MANVRATTARHGGRKVGLSGRMRAEPFRAGRTNTRVSCHAGIINCARLLQMFPAAAVQHNDIFGVLERLRALQSLPKAARRRASPDRRAATAVAAPALVWTSRPSLPVFSNARLAGYFSPRPPGLHRIEGSAHPHASHCILDTVYVVDERAILVLCVVIATPPHPCRSRVIGVPLDWGSSVSRRSYVGRGGAAGVVHCLTSTDGNRNLYFFVPSRQRHERSVGAGGSACGLDHVALVTKAGGAEDILGGVGLFDGLPVAFDASTQWAAVGSRWAIADGEFRSEVLGRNAIVEVARHATALAAQRILPGDFRRAILAMLRR